MGSQRNSFFSTFLEHPYFTNNQLKGLAQKFSMPQGTLNSYVYKSLRDGHIISLKRNYYVSRPFYEKHKTDTSYLFFLANILLQPSYVSLEAALQYYGLFAEAVNVVTSVTAKLPRRFTNRTGKYFYRKINEKFFSGFTTVKEKFEFNIALPHKAVFDYLYFYTNRFTQNVHRDILEELRIDTTNLSSDEKKNLKKLIAIFTDIKLNI